MGNALELIAEFHVSNSDPSSHIKGASRHHPNSHLSSTLPTALISILNHMSDVTHNAISELPFYNKENQDPLPIPPRPATPATSQSQLCVQNQPPHIIHIHTNGAGNETGLTSIHPDDPSNSELNNSDQENIDPPYQRLHVLVPLFDHLAEYTWQFPSQMTLKLTALLFLLSPESETLSTTMKSTSPTLKRSSELLGPCDTEVYPVKMMRQQLLLHDSTKSGDWTLNLLPLSHPISSPMWHRLYITTCKSWQVLWPPVPESVLWLAEWLCPSNHVPEVGGVRGLKLTKWEQEYHRFCGVFMSELKHCLH